MNNPFVFGRVPDIESFVNRNAEVKRLQQNISNTIHTILISPRRWGKTSMIRLLEQKIGKSKQSIFCHLDLFSTFSEEEFLKAYSQQILKALHSPGDNILQLIKNLFSSITPSISIKEDGGVKLTLNFNNQSSYEIMTEVLDMAEKLAQKKGKKLVVCLDEFQNIEQFQYPVDFQKKLRSSWQHHKNVCYILYGSKRSMMSSMFEQQNMPFYKFGDIMYLNKIEAKHFRKFIMQVFTRTGKTISEKQAAAITELMDNHPYYIQQYAHILWNNTKKEVTNELMDQTTTDIIGRNELLFDQMFNNLSTFQKQVLRMLIFEKGEKYTSTSNILQYNLGNSSAVIQALNALEKKEIIDRFAGKPIFLDPVFRMWLLSRVFKEY